MNVATTCVFDSIKHSAQFLATHRFTPETTPVRAFPHSTCVIQQPKFFRTHQYTMSCRFYQTHTPVNLYHRCAPPTRILGEFSPGIRELSLEATIQFSGKKRHSVRVKLRWDNWVKEESISGGIVSFLFIFLN